MMGGSDALHGIAQCLVKLRTSRAKETAQEKYEGFSSAVCGLHPGVRRGGKRQGATPQRSCPFPFPQKRTRRGNGFRVGEAGGEKTDERFRALPREEGRETDEAHEEQMV